LKRYAVHSHVSLLFKRTAPGQSALRPKSTRESAAQVPGRASGLAPTARTASYLNDFLYGALAFLNLHMLLICSCHEPPAWAQRAPASSSQSLRLNVLSTNIYLHAPRIYFMGIVNYSDRQPVFVNRYGRLRLGQHRAFVHLVPSQLRMEPLRQSAGLRWPPYRDFHDSLDLG